MFLALVPVFAVATANLALGEAITASQLTGGLWARDGILKGLCSLHVARQGRKGRHFIMFRLAPRASGNLIEVLRILHDSMDLPRHLEAGDE